MSRSRKATAEATGETETIGEPSLHLIAHSCIDEHGKPLPAAKAGNARPSGA